MDVADYLAHASADRGILLSDADCDKLAWALAEEILFLADQMLDACGDGTGVPELDPDPPRPPVKDWRYEQAHRCPSEGCYAKDVVLPSGHVRPHLVEDFKDWREGKRLCPATSRLTAQLAGWSLAGKASDVDDVGR